MAEISESIKVLSANCQGLYNNEKRQDVLHYLKETNASIVCLQDTHLLETHVPSVRQIWSDCYLHGVRTNSRGVGILLNNNFEYEVLECHKDENGNYIQLYLKCSSMIINLINIYAPNHDDPKFFNEIKNLTLKGESDYVILCGDFNLVLDPKKDSHNYKKVNNPKARLATIELMDEVDLMDLYRTLHTDTIRYTWRRKNPVKQARLDYFLVSSSTIDIINSCNIRPGYRSDHSILEMHITINPFKRGKGIWKFNNNLLYQKDYLTMINEIISDEKVKYAVPVYSLDFIKSSDNVQFTIEDDLFLETLLLRIRGETIRFSAFQKQSKAEKDLIKDIETLENMENLPTGSSDLLSDKRVELEDLRKDKIKGQLTRTRLQWLNEGEKPTSFFCNLERKQYLEKTIRKIKTPEGTLITDQQKVLNEIQKFYSNLFQNSDRDLKEENITSLLDSLKSKKVNTPNLGHAITVQELANTLKKMKNGKSPGIDGISVDFLKVFWTKLKYFITNCINVCYKKGKLSYSLKKSVIICLPKGNKDRQCLKNWRPISLLCVIYKMASAVIAERIKPYLDKIISRNQTGFLKGRYIGESTRLIYDLMHYTEEKKLPGLLVQIDFAKAFDSLSWNFLYKVMEFFGFNKDLISWIRLFNTDIQAFALQCGNLSNPIPIKRGCRQGDPISPYLFILSAEILSLLFENTPDVIGIKTNKHSFKITQFADDTTLMLNGTVGSLQAALNLIEVFGSVSGLKINSEKTKIIWIGCKKHSKEKLNVTLSLNWGETEFTLLGIKFSTDLQKMPKINFDSALQSAQKLIKCWKRRNLTPIGRIAVIKTLILPIFNHLFVSLPTPENVLKEINNLLFGYLWEGKPEKINRQAMYRDYGYGGLKMIDIGKFEKSLKLCWLKRIVSQTCCAWLQLLKEIVNNINKLTSLGGEWCTNILDKVNPFWKDVFQNWLVMCQNNTVTCNQDILSSTLWFNKQISVNKLFYPDWFANAISTVADVVDSTGKVIDLESLNKKYNIRINILNYYTVKKFVNKFVVSHKKGENFEITRPFIPYHAEVLFDPQKGSKKFYSKLADLNRPEQRHEVKWNLSMSCSINWETIYRACFRSITDNRYIWFQYRTIYRILGTNEYLYKLKLSRTNLCRLCSQNSESIEHLFLHCSHVIILWNNIKTWLFSKISYNADWTNVIKVLYAMINKTQIFGQSTLFL